MKTITITCNCHFCAAVLVRRTAPSIKSKLHFCNNKCKGDWQRTRKPVSEEWLRQKYVTEGLDCTQIAKLVSRDPKGVWRWLKDYKIPTRPRGTDRRQHFKRGHKLGVGRVISPETRKKQSDIAKAQGRVPYDPAVGSYMKGKKGAQTPNWKGGITPERQAFNGSPAWKHAVREVYKRDQRTCQRCGKVKRKGDRQPFDIHHVVGFACVPLRAVVANLVLLCEPCHYWVHSNDNAQREWIKDESP